MERQAHGFLIVFDLTNRVTFENVQKWLLQLRTHATVEDPAIVILGNKSDLPSESQVTSLEINEFMYSNKDVQYFEVSARSGFNV